jgi:hypothetical protein
MKKMILGAVLLLSGLGCQGSTLIGGTDGGACHATFPQFGFFGENILFPASDTFASLRPTYELVVQHDASEQVRVVMSLLSGDGIWYVGGYANDWRFTNYSGEPDGGPAGTQTFEAPNVTGEFEESISFTNAGRAQVTVFACGSTTPTMSKVISWGPYDGGTSHDAGPILLDGATPFDAGLTFGGDGGRD